MQYIVSGVVFAKIVAVSEVVNIPAIAIGTSSALVTVYRVLLCIGLYNSRSSVDIESSHLVDGFWRMEMHVAW
jgi:hypothetical protein